MVEHVNISDPDRHEVKHASSAGANQVLHANGDGTTQFKFIDYANLINKPTVEGYSSLINAYSSATQNPSAVNTPLQVNFGSGQSTADVSLSATGELTFLTEGDYALSLFLRFGRSAGVGNAILFNRFLINGVQGLNSNAISIPDSNSVYPFGAALFLSPTEGDVFTMEIMRDSSGINTGGLFALTPSLGSWNIAPSATLVVSKLGGPS